MGRGGCYLGQGEVAASRGRRLGGWGCRLRLEQTPWVEVVLAQLRRWACSSGALGSEGWVGPRHRQGKRCAVPPARLPPPRERAPDACLPCVLSCMRPCAWWSAPPPAGAPAASLGVLPWGSRPEPPRRPREWAAAWPPLHTALEQGQASA